MTACYDSHSLPSPHSCGAGVYLDSSYAGARRETGEHTSAATRPLLRSRTASPREAHQEQPSRADRQMIRGQRADARSCSWPRALTRRGRLKTYHDVAFERHQHAATSSLAADIVPSGRRRVARHKSRRALPRWRPGARRAAPRAVREQRLPVAAVEVVVRRPARRGRRGRGPP